MARTLATAPSTTGGPDDLTGDTADGIESLRQRVLQRLRMQLGEWAFAPTDGTPRIIGHQITRSLAAAAITDAIATEGGDEILTIEDVTAEIDHDTRTLTYHATVHTIWGALAITHTV